MLRSANIWVIAMLIVTTSTSAAIPIIERIPVFQPVRIAYIKVTPAYRGMNVIWKIAAYTIDESSNQFAVAGDTLVGAGDSVQVLLIKYAMKYSYYKIFAYQGNEIDSMELQVFSKGSMQKAIYRTSWFPTKPIPVYFYLPGSLSSSTPQVVVMHGIDRNAYNYGLAWTEFASRNGWIVIAPEFNATDWTTDAYNLGNMFTGNSGSGSLNPKEKWTFTLVSDIQRMIVRGFGLRDSTFILWGHSAGAQFVHRKVFFSYDPLIKVAISANAGWYTAPDTAVVFPWGVRHQFLSLTSADLQQFVSRNLVLMRGTADTLRDSHLDVDPLSDAQGRNRFERAAYFYRSGIAVSPSLQWKLIDVPNVGHDYRLMAVAAGEYLSRNTTVVERNIQSDKHSLELSSHPNPFNPSTTVRFVVPYTSATTLVMYSMLGERIQTLVDETLSPGTYSVRFDGTTLANGVYVCRLACGPRSSSVKLMLLK